MNVMKYGILSLKSSSLLKQHDYLSLLFCAASLSDCPSSPFCYGRGLQVLTRHLLTYSWGWKSTRGILTNHSGLEGVTLVNSLHLGHHIAGLNTCFAQGSENIQYLRINIV